MMGEVAHFLPALPSIPRFACNRLVANSLSPAIPARCALALASEGLEHVRLHARVSREAPRAYGIAEKEGYSIDRK